MSFGFVMIRHARSETDDILGEKCIESIRMYHPGCKIMIVDDYSVCTFSQTEAEAEDIIHVRVEEHDIARGKGEILAWYFFWKLRPFENACVLHDSMFLTAPVKITPTLANKGTRLWHFNGGHMLGMHNEHELMSKINVSFANSMYDEPDGWQGCFGVTGILSWTSINFLSIVYHLFDLIPHVHTRTDRMAVERIFGWMLSKSGVAQPGSLYGDIHTFPRAFYPTEDAKIHETIMAHDILKIMPIIKIWRGR
jgi:hypothetical protein